ncbi:MAG: alpha/beta hydrolase [Planctomycetes bacterium]|nr:alpha/beta hydrolase [Planctomycetota bacterium]
MTEHESRRIAARGVRPRWRAFLLGCLVVGVILSGLALRGLGDRWFFFPEVGVPVKPQDPGVQIDDVTFAAPGGPVLHGWWLRAEGSARGTVVYCHGNHANRGHHFRFVQWLPRRGFDVLIFDYRGYGDSAGSPTREGLVDDTIAAIDLALARDPGRTVVFGHSLGGALGIVAAAARPAVRAVIAESTFATYRAAARASMPALGPLVPWLVSGGHDPVDALARIAPRPLLVVHGREDRITPLALGEELFAAAREPKSLHLVHRGGHVAAWVTEGAAFEERFCAFVDPK